MKKWLPFKRVAQRYNIQLIALRSRAHWHWESDINKNSNSLPGLNPGGTVVEQSIHNLKVKGSTLALREIITKNWMPCHDCNLVAQWYNIQLIPWGQGFDTGTGREILKNWMPSHDWTLQVSGRTLNWYLEVKGLTLAPGERQRWKSDCLSNGCHSATTINS